MAENSSGDSFGFAENTAAANSHHGQLSAAFSRVSSSNAGRKKEASATDWQLSQKSAPGEGSSCDEGFTVEETGVSFRPQQVNGECRSSSTARSNNSCCCCCRHASNSNSSSCTNCSSSMIDRDELSDRYVAYLRSIKDSWSSCHAARLLTPSLLSHIESRFIGLSTPLKVRVLTSFLYLPPALREGNKTTLSRIVQEGETDPNEWVKKLSRILLPFITSGRVDLRETDTETAFRIIHFLDEQKALHPEEGSYRRKAGFEQQHLCDPDIELEAAEAAAAAAEAAAAAAAEAAATTKDPVGAAPSLSGQLLLLQQQQLLSEQLQKQLELQQPATLEMTLFSARLNFDELVKGIERRGTEQLQRAVITQQQREAAAATAAAQQQQHTSSSVPLRKSSIITSSR